MPHPAALILAQLSLLLLPTGAAAEERRPFSMVGSGVAGEVFDIGKQYLIGFLLITIDGLLFADLFI